MVFEDQIVKSEFIEKAAELETADIVSVKGLFSNMIDMKQENTAVLVYLYDCEISKQHGKKY